VILGALDRLLQDCDLEAINVAEIAAMIRADRAAGLAPDGLDAAVLAAVLLEALGGQLTRAQLMDGAAAIWLSTIYGISWMPEWSQETA
jgi:hypothetical protein